MRSFDYRDLDGDRVYIDVYEEPTLLPYAVVVTTTSDAVGIPRAELPRLIEALQHGLEETEPATSGTALPDEADVSAVALSIATELRHLADAMWRYPDTGTDFAVDSHGSTEEIARRAAQHLAHRYRQTAGGRA